MTTAIPTTIDIKEIVQNCLALIAANSDEAQFESIAKAIILQMTESQNAPSTLRTKLSVIKKQLNDYFKNTPKYTTTEIKKTTKGDVEATKFLLCKFIETIEKATGIQDGKATAKDYPRIKRNVLIYTGKETGEIVLPEHIVTTTEVETATEIETKETPISIDATEYLRKASELIKSDDWCDIAIGVAMATLRREVEVCAAMSFEAKDDYTLIINTPVKKRGNKERYYEIPCLLPADEIEEAIERLRKLTDFERFDIAKQLGNKTQANTEFNNCYKQPLLNRYNEFMRSMINTAASVDGNDYFHQLRSIGTAIYKQAKRQTYKRYSAKFDNEILTFVSGVLVHESTSSTVKYGAWDISNVPEYVLPICNRSYGNTIKKEVKDMTLINFDIASLKSGLAENEKGQMLFNEIFTRQRLNDPKALGEALIAVFTQAVKEPEKSNALLTAISPKTARGVIGSERITKIIDAMLKHNEGEENRVYICESQVRAAYTHIFGGQVSFDLARKVFEDKGSTIADHNSYKSLTTTDNLKLRGVKILSVYSSLKKIVDGM